MSWYLCSDVPPEQQSTPAVLTCSLHAHPRLKMLYRLDCALRIILFSHAQVELECLNSVAPPPLNWKMWCPGKDATVKGWTDKSGAAHRSITLRPQRNMTSTMATWFITTHVLGLMPPVVEFEGNVSDSAAHTRNHKSMTLVSAAFSLSNTQSKSGSLH